MTRLTKIMGICGFITCLFIMYGTNHGIRGIQLYNRSFRLLDMQFHYNIETVRQTFEQISKGGRSAYQKFLMLDFIFIICFLITMFTITDTVFASSNIKIILFIVCGLRAIFDITENILLLTMLGRYPVFSKFIATLCSWFTTFKFIMLYIWLLFIAMQTIRYIWLNSHKF
jgi:hypothetical protein